MHYSIIIYHILHTVKLIHHGHIYEYYYYYYHRVWHV